MFALLFRKLYSFFLTTMKDVMRSFASNHSTSFLAAHMHFVISLCLSIYFSSKNCDGFGEGQGLLIALIQTVTCMQNIY